MKNISKYLLLLISVLLIANCNSDKSVGTGDKFEVTLMYPNLAFIGDTITIIVLDINVIREVESMENFDVLLTSKNDDVYNLDITSIVTYNDTLGNLKSDKYINEIIQDYDGSIFFQCNTNNLNPGYYNKIEVRKENISTAKNIDFSILSE